MLLIQPALTAGPIKVYYDMAKHTARPWFIKIRGSYLPHSWQGWLLYVPYTLFLVGSAVVATSQETSLASTGFVIFSQWVAATVVMTWIAAAKS